MPGAALAPTASNLERRYREAAPAGVGSTLRSVRSRSEEIEVRRGVLQPVYRMEDAGVMVEVFDGGVGYAATPDTSVAGLREAFARARAWARDVAGRTVPGLPAAPPPAHVGEHRGPAVVPWESVPLADKIARLQGVAARMTVDPRVVDWGASLWHVETETLHLTSEGGRVWQRFEHLVPALRATAADGPDSQTRTLGGSNQCRQGGLEVLEAICAPGLDLGGEAHRVAAEAVALLEAPECPAGRRDLLAAPDQMTIQVHESIGHPLELDRILGDERNYAGRSWVTPDLFGHYRWGSELLDVVFDPTVEGQAASYAFDDEGQPAERVAVIERGVLVRALGGHASEARAAASGAPVAGVANARATSWRRPPIDRMANLNVEPGASSLADMIASVERGLYVRTNNSWSIDDSRDKFQFSCEWARTIEHGELGPVVRNAGYRGRSRDFWRSLRAVGDRSTFELHGTPYCGKGEPNQSIRVGHATPACLFGDVEVFGGD